MLKIKDNVDLKELEKFGFKPKYDIDTGEKDRYVFDSSMSIKVKDREIKAFRQCNGYNEIDLEYFCADFVNEALYDLIKADLVEKI